MNLLKKVLIVDDDPDARLIVRQVLKKLDFLLFLEAKSGEEAIVIAHEQRPDLILMDICMPGMDGYEACRQIKCAPLLKSTIIIFMTAVCMDEIDDKIIQVGGDDLLRKPLDASELYFRVKNYLTLIVPQKDESQKTESECKSSMECQLCDAESTVSLGQGFLYQYDMKCLCKDNTFIPLMRQEFLLLETLLRCKHQVVSYELLVSAISEGEKESSIANVRTLVKLLRHKTYDGLIKNLSSYGYQLVV